MKCPTCDVDLVMTERSGVEIDYCPKCRGVWLDRGELDKIIERSATGPRGSGENRIPNQDPSESYVQHGQYSNPGNYAHSGHSGHRGDHQDSRHYGNGKRKRRSALEELFDFGD